MQTLSTRIVVLSLLGVQMIKLSLCFLSRKGHFIIEAVDNTSGDDKVKNVSYHSFQIGTCSAKGPLFSGTDRRRYQRALLLTFVSKAN
jgi:hypothetical protein